MSIRFARTRIACAIAALAARAGRRAGPGSRLPAQRDLGIGPGDRLCRRRCRRRGRQHPVGQRRRPLAHPQGPGHRRAAHDQAVDGVRQCLLGGGGPAVAGRRRRRRRRHELGAQPVLRGAHQRPVVGRHRHHRALGPGHRIRRRLDGPLPGHPLQHRDDQCQPGRVVEAGQQLRPGLRAELPAHRRRIHQPGQLLGGAAQRRGSRRHPARLAHLQRHRRGDPGPGVVRAHQGRRRRLGLECRPAVEHQPATIAWACTTVPASSTTSPATRSSCTRRRRRRRRVGGRRERRAVRRGRDLQGGDPAHRQPVALQRPEPAVWT